MRLGRHINRNTGRHYAAVLRRLQRIARTTRDGIGHHAHDALRRAQRHHRPDIHRVIGRIAHLQRLGRAHKGLQELVVHRRLDDHPLRRDALLPAGLEGRTGDALGGGLDIGIGQHDVGSVGAQLSQKLLGTGGTHQRITRGSTTGEGHRHHQFVTHQGLGRVTIASDDIEQSGRQAGLNEQLCHLQRHPGRGRMRLDHHGVASGQRRSDLLHQQVDWRIERRHRGHHTKRDMPGEAHATGSAGHRIHRHCFARQVQHLRRTGTQESRRAIDLEAGGLFRLADIADQHGRDLRRRRFDRRRRCAQPLRTLRQTGATVLQIGGMGIAHCLVHHARRTLHQLSAGLQINR